MEHNLEQKIMKRVMRTYYLKKIINPLMFKIYTLLIALVGMSSFVSFTNVFRNMPSLFEVDRTYYFISSAITNTEASVQLILSVVLVVVILLIRDTVKNLNHTPRVSTQRAV